jgi:hypothetical protein
MAVARRQFDGGQVGERGVVHGHTSPDPAPVLMMAVDGCMASTVIQPR